MTKHEAMSTYICGKNAAFTPIPKELMMRQGRRTMLHILEINFSAWGGRSGSPMGYLDAHIPAIETIIILTIAARAHSTTEAVAFIVVARLKT
jgi:hypothetical protein